MMKESNKWFIGEGLCGVGETIAELAEEYYLTRAEVYSDTHERDNLVFRATIAEIISMGLNFGKYLCRWKAKKALRKELLLNTPNWAKGFVQASQKMSYP